MSHVAVSGLSAFEEAVSAVRAGEDAEARARRLYARLTPDERLRLLDGDTPFWPGVASMIGEGYNVTPYVHGAIDRLGIPGIRFIDGPRGCVTGHGTAFPVPMARGATWDVALEERVGEVIRSKGTEVIKPTRTTKKARSGTKWSDPHSTERSSELVGRVLTRRMSPTPRTIDKKPAHRKLTVHGAAA